MRVVTKPGRLIAIVLLSLSSACADLDAAAGPPRTLNAAAMPAVAAAPGIAKPAARDVRRPGEVLLADRTARRAALRALP
ncbi:MAG TPA: hypothetical protein VF606_08955, partial [Geminicoccaceae bacterium]